MVEIRALGEVTVFDTARRIRLPTKKHYALLVYLAAHPDRPFLRDRLATLFWGDSPDRRARHSLNQTLYGIRKCLPALRIQVTNQEVVMPAGAIEADFLAFRQAVDRGSYREASRLYTGDFLEGFSIPNSPEFEEWQENERGTLKRLAVQSLTYLLDEEERARNWDCVEELASRIIRLDPFKKSAHSARIRAIAARGDLRRARLELQRIRGAIGGELGDIFKHIEPAAQWTWEAPVTADIVLENDEAQSPTKFVGRVEPYRRICAEWTKVQLGYSRVVIVSGEAGIGKTRFCNQFLRLAAIQGARCFSGRCYSTESSLPFSGIVDAFADGLQPEDIDTLDPRWRTVLSDVIPHVDGPAGPPVSSFDREEYRLRILESLVQVAINVSDSAPLVLFIDDFQWADHSTITVVHYMARRISANPIMILIVMRSDEIFYRTELMRFREEISRYPHCVDIVLTEMDRDEVGLLVASFCDRHGVIVPIEYEVALYQRTGGRPFFLIELLRAFCDAEASALAVSHSQMSVGGEALPQSIRSFLKSRFELLSQDEAQILGALAVLGRSSSFRMLQAVAGLEDIVTSDAVTSLIRKGFLKDASGEIGFVHDLLREAAYDWIGNYKRRVLHERAGNSLANDQQTSAGILAVHYNLAENKSRAFEYALKAAEASEKMHSLVEAQFYLNMALNNAYDYNSRLLAYDHLANFLFRSRRFGEAETYFEKLGAYYRSPGQHRGALIAEVNSIAATLHRGRMSAGDAVRRFESCVDVAEEIGDRDLVSTILRLLINAAHSENQRDTVLRWTEKLIAPEYITEKSPVTVRNLNVASITIGIYRSAREGLELANRACELSQELGDRLGLAGALTARAGNRMHLGMLSLAWDDVRVGAELAERLENISGLVDLWAIGALVAAECGDWSEAEELYTRIGNTTTIIESEYHLIIAHANHMIMDFERGNKAQAETQARDLIEMNQTLSNLWFDLTAWSILGLCALDRGAVEEARKCRDEVLRRYEGKDFWISDVSYAEIFLARLSSLEGNVERAIERLEQAIAAYEDRDVLCRSRMQLERARLLRELNPAESRREAEAVLERAREMGARPLMEKAEAILTWAAGMEQTAGAATTR